MQGEAIGQEFRVDERRPRGARRVRYVSPDELDALVRIDDLRSLGSVLITIVPLAVTLVVGIVFWSAWVVLLLPIIAAQQHAIFVLVHEASHYRLFSNRRLNDAVGRALGSVTGVSMCTYRIIHRLHHNHLLSDADPDIALNGGYPRGKAYLLRKLATDLAGLTAWKTYKYFFGAPAANATTNIAQRPLDDTSAALRNAALADRRTIVIVQLLLPLSAFALGGIAGLAKYVVLWIVPAVTIVQAMLRVRAIAEHGAPPATDSAFTAARTNLANPLLRFFLFPHHVGYHIEHHLYPAVPHYRLPGLHALLRERGALDDAELRRFGETWRRVYADRAPTA